MNFTTNFRLSGNQARNLYLSCYTQHHSPSNPKETGGTQYFNDERRKELNEPLYFLLRLPIGTEVSVCTVKEADGPGYTSISFNALNIPIETYDMELRVYNNETTTAIDLAKLFLNADSYKCFQTNMLVYFGYSIKNNMIH